MGLVVDASVVINLNATLCASDIIGTFRSGMSVTENARIELEGGIRNGHRDAEKLRLLIKQGAVRVVHLGHAALAIYESLIEGAAEMTLDDGEAATIAYAYETSAIAILDERKARRLCASRFPHVNIGSSAELLSCDCVRRQLGKEQQITAIMNALRNGRMRVPIEHVPKIVKLIGEENAVSCTSLPRSARSILAAH